MMKQFSTLAVLGVATGIVLEDGGFSGIHEVMDHFYPGIMTLGCAAMSEQAAREVKRQIPHISALGPCTSENWKEYAGRAVDVLGERLSIDGPVKAVHRGSLNAFLKG